VEKGRGKRFARFLKLLQIPALTAESHRVRTERSQNGDAAEREMLRSGNSPRKRQLKHKVCAAGERLLCPCPFGKYGCVPALNEIPAQYDCYAVGAPAFQLFYQEGVPPVQRIVFGYNTRSHHNRINSLNLFCVCIIIIKV
jgi:hypothetical protein